MQLTVTSIMSIIFFSGISIGLIQLIFRKNIFIMKHGSKIILLGLMLIGLRLLLPVELLFTKNILISSILPEICLFLLIPLPLFNLNIQMLLLYIWIAGAIFCIIKILYSYLKLKKSIQSLEENPNEYFQEIIHNILNYNVKSTRFRIVKTDKVTTPMIFGIRKPYILIPDLNFSKKEWYYILRHEIAHFYHGDLFIKLLFIILHAIYWWNPFMFPLKRQVSNILEINADKEVVKKLDQMERIEYLECLLKLAKMRKKESKDQHWMAAFSNDNSLNISSRVQLVLDNKALTQKNISIDYLLGPLLVMFIVIFPNFFIFEPYGASDDVEAESFSISEENSYFILNEEGTYDFYLNNEYQVTVQNVFDENIKIYKDVKEIQNEK